MTVTESYSQAPAARAPLVRRMLTRPGDDPFELVGWCRRPVQITDSDGTVARHCGVCLRRRRGSDQLVESGRRDRRPALLRKRARACAGAVCELVDRARCRGDRRMGPERRPRQEEVSASLAFQHANHSAVGCRCAAVPQRRRLEDRSGARRRKRPSRRGDLPRRLANGPHADKTSMPDRVRVGPYGAFRRLAGNGPLLRILAGGARRPMLPTERYHERSVLTEPLAHASARRTATTCPAQALACPTCLSKHLGRYPAPRGKAPQQAIGAIAVTVPIA
jgi:hypothetical protein